MNDALNVLVYIVRWNMERIGVLLGYRVGLRESQWGHGIAVRLDKWMILVGFKWDVCYLLFVIGYWGI